MKILNISDAAALGIHSMIILCSDPEKRVNLNKISTILQASEHHLSKVMQRLVKSNLVTSVRGPNGGFMIKKTALSKSVLEVLEIFEGEIDKNPCLLKKDKCVVLSCIYGTFLEEINEKVINYLSNYKLQALVGKKIENILEPIIQ
jgi:Rrf2 family protein